MKTLIPIMLVILIAGCSLQSIPLKGNYDTCFTTVSDKPFDTIWNKTIDLFACKGFAINYIDKSNGLIISEKSPIDLNYTYENSSGKLKNPNAFVVLSQFVINDSVYPPDDIEAQWSVRLKPYYEPGKTVIMVNLTNISASRFFNKTGAVYYTAKSTGKFEQMIADQIK